MTDENKQEVQVPVTPDLPIEEIQDPPTPTSLTTAEIDQPQQVYAENTSFSSVPHIVICGESGVGKTHLAASSPDGLCLDIEDGAGSEFDNDHRIVYNPGDPDLALKILKNVEGIKKYKRDGEYIVSPNGIRFHHIVVDTLDILFKNATEQYIGRAKMNGNQLASIQNGLKAGNFNAIRMELKDYGAVNTLVSPLINKILSIGIPVVWITHEGGQKAQYYPNGGLQKMGELRLGVGGQIGEMVQNLGHATIFVMYDPFKNQRVILTKPQVYDDRRVYAKDRHSIFPKGVLPYERETTFLESFFSYFTW